jgi:chorismate mutase/prephenate dehydratase
MAAMKDLSDWRNEIDELDRQIVALLNQRAECVLNLAPLKRERRIDILDTSREDAVMRNLREANGGPLPDESFEAIFRAVMAAMRELQRESASVE